MTFYKLVHSFQRTLQIKKMHLKKNIFLSPKDYRYWGFRYLDLHCAWQAVCRDLFLTLCLQPAVEKCVLLLAHHKEMTSLCVCATAAH